MPLVRFQMRYYIIVSSFSHEEKRTEFRTRWDKKQKGNDMEKDGEITHLKDEILHLTALSGEVSPIALSRLERSPKYVQNCLYDLMQGNMLLYCCRDELEGYRLKPKGKHYLAGTYPNRFADFFTVGNGSNKVRLDLIHRRRNLHSSEIVTMMYKNGIAVFPDDKPKLYVPLADSSQSSQARYYTSYEVKDIGEDGIKINNTRFNGLLRCHSGDYLLYNMGSGLIKWETASEGRAVFLLGSMLQTKVKQIMLGHSMELAWDILKSEGGKQHQYFRIDEMGDSVYYIPITSDGDFLLRMNYLTDSMQRLKYSVLQKMNLQPCPNSLDCDGYADDKTAVLFTCDMDLKRIRNLKIGAESKFLKLIIICFDFQADLLRRYFGDNAVIRTIDARKTAELFKIPYGGGAS